MMMSIYLSVCLSGVYGNYQTSQRDYDSMNVTTGTTERNQSDNTSFQAKLYQSVNQYKPLT